MPVEGAGSGDRRIVNSVADGLNPALKAVSDAVLAVGTQQSTEDVLQQLVHSARTLVGARYAALGVPEIWHFDGKKLRCLHLRKGKYQPAEMSLAFPFLRPAELQRFIELLPAQDELAVMRAFGEWVQTLRPRQ